MSKSKTYRATFRSDTGWATEEIKARTPAQALQRARRLAENDPIALDWSPYCGDAAGIDEIEITDQADDIGAVWQSEGLTLRLAAPDLFDALHRLYQRERAAAAESGFEAAEMDWLDDARHALNLAKPGTVS